MCHSSRLVSTLPARTNRYHKGTSLERAAHHMQVSIWLYILYQTSLTSCLLLCIGLSAGLRRRSPVRLCAVALAVSILSAWMTNAAPLLRGMTLFLCASSAPILAWPGAPKRIWMRMIAGGCFLSLGMAGMLRFAAPFGLPSVLIVLGVCMLLRAVPAVLPKQETAFRLATVDVRHGAHHLTLTGLIDSGNLLRDPVTGLPVIVISRRAAMRLVQLPGEGKVTYPFRLITVHTVSGVGLMTVFHPDSVCLLTERGWQRVETLLGLSPEGYDGFQALVPAGLMAGDMAMTI